MKGRTVPGITVFFLVLAVVLLLSGIILGICVYRYSENLMFALEHHEEVLSVIRETTAYAMISACLVMAGIGILTILVLHMLRRTTRIQREAEALRKKNEAMEALNLQTRKLAHHQRLEIIGTLTSSIAHEFNNLLTPIMGYSLMAMEKLPDDESELYEELLEIYTSSCKAKEIISRLSDLSRKQTETSFREVSPDDLIRKMVRVAEPAKPDHVQVQMNLNCWDQRLEANEIQFSQLILNLILNSFHAMEAHGGILTLTTSLDESHIQIQVTDTGRGISKENQSRIFEPFFTTKETGKGTGLGLAIVAQVVEDHRGTIRVKSKEGSGTTFLVRLPRNRTDEEI
jgi:signal transduction histidine kinase